MAALVAATIALGAAAGPAQAQGYDTYRDLVRERLGGGGNEWVPQVNAVKGTKGYRVTVGGSSGNLMITAYRKPGFAWYTTRGKTSTKRLRARFGKFGKVNLRFKAKGKVRTIKPPRGCTGRGDKVQPGVWRGVFRFKGEGRYTRVKKRRLRGKLVKYGNYVCPLRARRGIPAGQLVYLYAERKRAGRQVSFGAEKRDEDGARPDFYAYSEERVGKVGIGRNVVLRGRPDDFTFTFLPFTGLVEPPAPFSGTAAYSEAAGTWTGDLEVRFPGLRAALTGTGFDVEMGIVSDD